MHNCSLLSVHVYNFDYFLDFPNNAMDDNSDNTKKVAATAIAVMIFPTGGYGLFILSLVHACVISFIVPYDICLARSRVISLQCEISIVNIVMMIYL